jgi:hypothetical protein
MPSLKDVTLKTALIWAGSMLLSGAMMTLLAQWVLYYVSGGVSGLLERDSVWIAYAALGGAAVLLAIAFYVGGVERHRAERAVSPSDDSIRAFVSRVLTTAGILWMAGAGACSLFVAGYFVYRMGGIGGSREGAPLVIAWYVGGISVGLGLVIYGIGRWLRPKKP